MVSMVQGAARTGATLAGPKGDAQTWAKAKAAAAKTKAATKASGSIPFTFRKLLPLLQIETNKVNRDIYYAQCLTIATYFVENTDPEFSPEAKLQAINDEVALMERDGLASEGKAVNYFNAHLAYGQRAAMFINKYDFLVMTNPDFQADIVDLMTVVRRLNPLCAVNGAQARRVTSSLAWSSMPAIQVYARNPALDADVANLNRAAENP